MAPLVAVGNIHRPSAPPFRDSSQASERSILRALHKRNIRFRKLREKPALTDDDIKDRLAFAKKYHKKSKAWWVSNVHASIDGKCFQVYLNHAQRVHAAQHATFGAYRAPGKGLTAGYVKPKKSLKTGKKKNLLVIAAVGAGKVLMWHAVPTGRWSGQAAADVYSGPLKKALSAEYAQKRKHVVLEDNDPTGFKSTKGEDAKKASKIEVFAIPKRSPDLNVLDYSVWKEVNRRLRKQEKNWPSEKRETREAYKARLRRTAKNLPKEFILKSIGDMRRRCQRLLEAKGHFFEEGGRGGDQ